MSTERLGDLCHIRIGRTPSRANPEFWGGTVPWATISDLGPDTVTSTREGITEVAVREVRMQPVAPGTLLYSFKLTIGKMAVAGVPLFTNEAIAALTPKHPARLDPSYLRFALLTVDGGATSSVAVKGKTLNLQTLSDLLVPVVPMDVQRDLCALLTERLAAVESARTATLQSLALAKRLRLEAIEQSIGKTADWPLRALSSVADIQLGKMLSPASRTGRRPMPYLRNANVQWDRFDLRDVHEMDFDEREEVKFALRRGDVLVCEGGEPGRAAVWEGQIEPCLYQKALHRLRPIDDAVDPQYLVHRLWLSAMRGEFTNDQAQTTIAHLPAIRLAELQISTPPIGMQRRIVADVREQLLAIDAMTAAIDAELEAIEALPAALLHRAFDDLTG